MLGSVFLILFLTVRALSLIRKIAFHTSADFGEPFGATKFAQKRSCEQDKRKNDRRRTRNATKHTKQELLYSAVRKHIRHRQNRPSQLHDRNNRDDVQRQIGVADGLAYVVDKVLNHSLLRLVAHTKYMVLRKLCQGDLAYYACHLPRL